MIGPRISLFEQISTNETEPLGVSLLFTLIVRNLENP